MQIPTLYRGDDFNKKIGPLTREKLFQELEGGQLFTRLLDGGNPSEIYQSLDVLIQKHVDIGWKKTHFLSFSESEDMAKRYGLYLEPNADLPKLDEWYEGSVEKFALIQMNPDKIRFERYKEGVYCGKYAPGFKENEGKAIEILLIDVVKWIENNKSNSSKALINSRRDKEWLVLPYTKKHMSGTDTYEYTAKLDMGNPEAFSYKKYVIHGECQPGEDVNFSSNLITE